MARSTLNRILMFSILYSNSILLSCSGGSDSGTGIVSYIPVSEEVSGWSPVNEPQVFVGEDLFILINGGAELYHEYGFKQVVFQEFKSTNGKSINMEIFEMEDPSSAYGIYTFKTGEKGTEMDIGGGLMLEEYYLNFWKDDLLITLTGFDSEKETIDGLLALARGIENRIPEVSDKPALYGLLPEVDLNTKGIKYLQGNMALYNNYEFDSADIFRFRECMLGKYSDHRLLIFKYNVDDTVSDVFGNVMNIMKNSADFSGYQTIDDNAFRVNDKNNELVVFRQKDSYILVYVGNSFEQSQTIFSGITEK
ncbi:MAG: hypothetical protein GY863_11740 [bacterium]|nr:hypothetical protein [bacterium]